MRLQRTARAPVTAGRVGCRTCALALDVPAHGLGLMLWDFFSAHPAPCATWVDVAGLDGRED